MEHIEYRVRAGDTLSAIARLHRVGLETLFRLNGISDVNRIWAGQVLRIPKERRSTVQEASTQALSSSYRVRAGDTLSEIARRYRVTVDELAEANGISDPNRIGIGLVLKIPKRGSSAPRTQTSTSSSTLAASTKTPTAKIETTPPPKRVAFQQGEVVARAGRVNNAEGVNLRDAPDGTILRRLSFNTRVFVSRRFPGDWYFVTLDDKSFGYVYAKYISANPPEPWAVLHKIKPDESALAIVKKYYKGDAIQWGQDERFYVNVLVHANRGEGLRGIYKPSADAGWDKTRTRANYLIWVPCRDFAQGLRGRINSGSISYELWQDIKQAAEVTGNFLLGTGAFIAGVIHGALESVWDLVTGIVDLLELAWKLVKSIITLEFISDVKALWTVVETLDAKALIEAGLKSFVDRWNDENFLRRWHFRGWVIGYAIAEIVMAILTGAASLVKWAGKAGKIGKFLSKFTKTIKLAEKVTAVSKRVPEKTFKRLKGVVTRTADEASTAKKLTRDIPDEPKKSLPLEKEPQKPPKPEEPKKEPPRLRKPLDYASLSAQIRKVYTAADVEKLAAVGARLELTDKQIIDFLEMGSIAKPGKKPPKVPLTPQELQKQMENWVKVIQPRGYPYRFESLARFKQFQKHLKLLLAKYDIPDGRVVIQGSSLRTAAAKDIDIAIFVPDEAFSEFAQRCAKGISARSQNPHAARKILKDLEKRTQEGFVPKFYFDRVKGASFNDELRNLIEDVFKVEVDLSIMKASSKLDLYPSLEF